MHPALKKSIRQQQVAPAPVERERKAQHEYIRLRALEQECERVRHKLARAKDQATIQETIQELAIARRDLAEHREYLELR